MNLTLLVPLLSVTVIVLGAFVGVVSISLAKKKREAVDRWGHAAYSLWTGGEDCATWDQARARKSLQSWYGAGAYAAYWQVVRNLREGQTCNAAWDKVRALDLLRIGVAATYIDADQSRAEIAAIGAELQAQFRSWDELAQAFEAGMQHWQRGRGTTDPSELGRVQRNLPTLRQSVWPSIRFDAALAVED